MEDASSLSYLNNMARSEVLPLSYLIKSTASIVLLLSYFYFRLLSVAGHLHASSAHNGVALVWCLCECSCGFPDQRHSQKYDGRQDIVGTMLIHSGLLLLRRWAQAGVSELSRFFVVFGVEFFDLRRASKKDLPSNVKGVRIFTWLSIFSAPTTEETSVRRCFMATLCAENWHRDGKYDQPASRPAAAPCSTSIYFKRGRLLHLQRDAPQITGPRQKMCRYLIQVRVSSYEVLILSYSPACEVLVILFKGYLISGVRL